MSSNLPPGVTDSMLPGNRPEDIEWESVMEWADEQLAESGFTPDECRRAILIGMAAVNAERAAVAGMIQDAIADEMLWHGQ